MPLFSKFLVFFSCISLRNTYILSKNCSFKKCNLFCCKKSYNSCNNIHILLLSTHKNNISIYRSVEEKSPAIKYLGVY